jgi:SOS-response transcriptional repressor LexA
MVTSKSMKKTKLSSTLRSLLQKENISESELARQTGICQPVIHRIASGETDNPKIESLRPIAKYFSITVDQLIGDAPLDAHGSVFHVEQELFYLPLITLSQAVTWPKEKALAKNFVQTDIEITDSAYAIQLKDSTMYPMFPDGTLLIIELAPHYKHRDFVVSWLAGESQAIFKQLLIDGPKRYLKSVNGDYPLIEMTKKDKILGLMLQARIDFRRN